MTCPTCALWALLVQSICKCTLQVDCKKRARQLSGDCGILLSAQHSIVSACTSADTRQCSAAGIRLCTTCSAVTRQWQELSHNLGAVCTTISLTNSNAVHQVAARKHRILSTEVQEQLIVPLSASLNQCTSFEQV